MLDMPRLRVITSTPARSAMLPALIWVSVKTSVGRSAPAPSVWVSCPLLYMIFRTASPGEVHCDRA
ncbi:hypothetical protein ACQB6S_13795 [Propionibacteriaceae bacterium Y1923]